MSRSQLRASVAGFVTTALVLVGVGVGLAMQREYKSGVVWTEPPLVAPPKEAGAPPGDAVVLFDGKDLSQWKDGEAWEIKDGYAIVKGKNIVTKESFGDCQLHVEFATPEVVKGTGQGRGNSGIFLMDRYEVQVLDSHDNKTYFDGQCGSLYKQSPPMVNVCKKPGEWQTYDIMFEAPRFGDDGKVVKPGICTILHNGVCVQNHFELQGNTYYDRPAAYTKHGLKAPIRLQNHGNPVKFRNIWIRELVPMVGKKPEPKEKE